MKNLLFKYKNHDANVKSIRLVKMLSIVLLCFLIPSMVNAQPAITYPSGNPGLTLGTSDSRLVATIVETETTVEFKIIAIGELRTDAFDFAIFFNPNVLRLTNNTFTANYENLIGIASDLDIVPGPNGDLLNAVDIAPALIPKGWQISEIQQREAGVWPFDDDHEIFNYSFRNDMRALIVKPYTNSSLASSILYAAAGEIKLGASIYFNKVTEEPLLNSDIGMGVQTNQARERFCPKWSYSLTISYAEDGAGTRTTIVPELFAFRSPSSVKTESVDITSSTTATLYGSFKRGDMTPRFDMIDNTGTSLTGGARLNWDSIYQSGFIYTTSDVNITVPEFTHTLLIEGDPTIYDFPNPTEIAAGTFTRGGVTFYIKPSSVTSATNGAQSVDYDVNVSGLKPDSTYYAWAYIKYIFETSDPYPLIAERIEFIQSCVIEETINVAICPNRIYYFGGEYLTESGTYYDTIPLPNGCDSIVTLNLLMENPVRYSIEDTFCRNGTYDFNGTILTIPGIYRDTINLAGCDSIITLTLEAIEPVLYPFEDSFCEGETYLFNDKELTLPGIYRDTLISLVTGCDSIIILDLTVKPILRSTANPSICENNLPFRYGDSIFTSAGTKDVYFTAQTTGCDSIVTVTLTVNSLILTSTDNLEICENALPFRYGDSIFTAAGVKDVYFTAQTTGCDSVVTVTLTVNPTLTSTDNPSVCENALPFRYGDSIFTAAGVKDVYFIAQTTGCDSIVTVTLTVNPILRSTANPIICENALPFRYGDTIFTAAGVKDVYFAAQTTGCDSIVTVTLTVNPTLRSTANPIICENALPFHYGDSIFTAAGVKDVYFTAQTTDCDSIVTVTLTVNPVLRSTANPAVCEYNMPFQYGDSIFTAAGVKDVYFTAQTTGCDSIVTVTLTVNSVVLTSTDNPEICENALPFHYGDSVFIAAGVKDVYFIAQTTGCDSIVTVTLTVNPTLRSTDNPIICENALPFQYGDTIFTAAGIKDVYFTAQTTGCDSIVTVTLTVNPVLRSTDNPIICENALPFQYGDSIFTAAGIKDVYFIAQTTGCDSIVTVTLTVNPTLRSTDNPIICENALPFHYGDSIFTAAGTKDVYFTAQTTGCDSIVAVTLTVNPTLRSTANPTVCVNKLPFHYGDSVFTAAGVKDVYFTARTTGCDSIVTVTLTVNSVLTSTANPSVCENNLPFRYGDSIFTAAGIKDVYFTARTTGCDSIVTVMLTVIPVLRSTANPIICDNALPYTYGNVTFTAAGTRDVYFTAQTTGCDSIVTVTLTVNPTSRTPIDATIRVGESYNQNGFSIPVQNEPTTIHQTRTEQNRYLCDSLIVLNLRVVCYDIHEWPDGVCQNSFYDFNGRLLNASGIYRDTIPTTSGCYRVDILHLTIWPVSPPTTVVVTINEGESHYFNGNTYTVQGLYRDTLLNRFDCDSVILTFLEVLPKEVCPEIEIPSFFTPNADGRNDKWEINNIDCYTYTIYLYDRFGKLLHRWENNFYGWDGMYLGKRMPSTDYWYLIDLNDGRQHVGHFTLIGR